MVRQGQQQQYNRKEEIYHYQVVLKEAGDGPAWEAEDRLRFAGGLWVQKTYLWLLVSTLAGGGGLRGGHTARGEDAKVMDESVEIVY